MQVCFQRVGFTIKVIYYHIFMPTRQEFTYTPRRQTTTWLHSDYVNKHTLLSPMFNQNISLQSDSDSNSCSYSAAQDPSITSSFPLAGDLNEIKNKSEVSVPHALLLWQPRNDKSMQINTQTLISLTIATLVLKCKLIKCKTFLLSNYPKQIKSFVK